MRLKPGGCYTGKRSSQWTISEPLPPTVDLRGRRGFRTSCGVSFKTWLGHFAQNPLLHLIISPYLPLLLLCPGQMPTPLGLVCSPHSPLLLLLKSSSSHCGQHFSCHGTKESVCPIVALTPFLLLHRSQARQFSQAPWAAEGWRQDWGRSLGTTSVFSPKCVRSDNQQVLHFLYTF